MDTQLSQHNWLYVSHVFTIRRQRRFNFLPQIVLLRSRVPLEAATWLSTLPPSPPKITDIYATARFSHKFGATEKEKKIGQSHGDDNNCFYITVATLRTIRVTGMAAHLPSQFRKLLRCLPEFSP